MKSIAEFKRAASVGTVLHVVNHVYPELSGERTVVKAQTNSLCLSLPAGHPRAGQTVGSWLDMPKAKNTTFNADGSITITRSDWGDSGPFVTISIPSKETP